jgi:hypothetical protein
VVFLERSKLESMGYEIEDFQQEQGRYPDSLNEVPRLAGLSDVWGGAYQYRRKPDGFELASLGADGKPGGEGAAADIAVPVDWRRKRISVTRFLFHTPVSGKLMLTAALAGFCAAAIWYSAQPRLRPGIVVSLVSILITVGASVVVATYLAILHIAAEQPSGH